MSDTATLSSKFQISVPKAVREKEDWRPGQKLAFVPRDGGFLLVPVPSMTELKGLAKRANRDVVRDRDDRF